MDIQHLKKTIEESNFTKQYKTYIMTVRISESNENFS